MKRIHAIILIIFIALMPLSTYAAPAKQVNYSKTLEQIYKSKDVYKDTLNRLTEYNKNYSSITYLFSAGKSVQNRDLSVLKVGNGPKKIFINASHHPREYMGTILTLNQIQSLLDAYTSNSLMDGCHIKDLLDNKVSFYFMPLVNPDGVQICVNGTPSYYFNANRVDLNHNYDADWFKSITKDYSTGPSAFSEPETQAVRALCQSVEFDLTIAYHAAGDIIYWYYGQQGADKARDLAYANMLKNTTGYSLVSTSNYKSSTSGFKDWCVQKLKIPSFTLEIGGKQGIVKPLPFSVYSSVWNKNKFVPVRIANQLLKQTSFNTDKNIALIYKNSLIKLNHNIVSGKNLKYISINDTLNILGGQLTTSKKEELQKSGIAVGKITYIDIQGLCKSLGLTYKFDKPSNTIYLL